MKKSLLAAFFVCLTAPLWAEFALVYKSESDVKKTVFSPGLFTVEGVAVSAEGILAAGKGLMAGLQGQALHQATLIRFDNDLNLALIRLGDRVKDEGLQAAHKKNSDKTSLFLPELGQVAAVPVSTAPAIIGNGEKFVIRLNDIVGTDEGVKLVKKNRTKTNVIMAVVGQNIQPVWRVTIDVTAEPTLYFWKKGEDKGLNAIPTRSFNHIQQVMFKPYSNGSKIEIPLEVSSIKEEKYNLIVKVTTKTDKFETKIPVQFVDK